MKFELYLIVTVGMLVAGILYLIIFNENPEQPPKNAVIINALKNLQYDELAFTDTHYDRVDREKKYYASMTDVKPAKENSVQITFDANYFQRDEGGNYVKPKSKYSSQLIAVVNEKKAFIAGCDSAQLPFVTPAEPIRGKRLHILQYNGTIYKDGIQYYAFPHGVAYVPDDIECRFPEMVQLSLDTDFEINVNILSNVWDHDWD